MSDKLDLGIKDFSQLVSGAAILIAFFAGYKFALRNASSTETKQTSSKIESEPAPTESLRVSISSYILRIKNKVLYINQNLSNSVTMVTVKCF